MSDPETIRSFLFVFIREHLRNVPQTEAMAAIGYTPWDLIFEGRIERFSVANLVRILDLLGIGQQEVLESARFHSSLKRRRNTAARRRRTAPSGR